MMEPLDAAEARVLGSMLEKDLATPEYYPMSLNALVNACNQKNNREPVTSYDEATVERALDELRLKKLAAVITGAGMRVPKHRHLVGEAFNLGRPELAIMTVLLLRGQQTAGELRDRTERMYAFGGLDEVEAALQRLMERQPEPLVARLPRLPGTKEPRYAHLLSGQAPAEAQPAAADAPVVPRTDRIASLEAEVMRLRDIVENLQRTFEDFRRQFE